MIRWNMGSWVPIIAVGSSVEVLRGPRIILLGLIGNLFLFVRRAYLGQVIGMMLKSLFLRSTCYILADIGQNVAGM